MASSTYNTILIAINGEHRPLVEYETDTTGVLPGHLLELNSDNEVIVHNSAGADAVPLFAVESPYIDNPTQAAIDHAYAAGERARCVYAQPGDIIYAWLEDGESVGVGAYLDSAGTGALQAHTPLEISGTGPHTIPSNPVVAVALEAVAASGADERIKVRIV